MLGSAAVEARSCGRREHFDPADQGFWLGTTFSVVSALLTVIACEGAPLPSVPPIQVQVAPASLFILAPEPSFSVGEADGPEEYLFANIEGAVRLADGDVVVAVQASHEIRRFGPNGEHQWTAGQEGEGPGEFRGVELLSGCTNEASIVAYDFRNGTITMIDAEGNTTSSERFERRPWGYGLTCAPSGRLVCSDRGTTVSNDLTFRWTNGLAFADDPRSRTRVLRKNIPGEDRHNIVQDGVVVGEGPRPWGRELTFAATNEGVWVANGDDYEAEFLDWTGTTVRRIRWVGPDKNVTAADREAHRERICRGYRLLGAEDWQARCAHYWDIEEPLLPSTFPTVARLLVGDDGHLWVEHFRRPEQEREWLVFDSTGTWAATVRMPMRMFLQDAGRDWILVRHTTDDLGVETLAIYPIIMPVTETP